CGNRVPRIAEPQARHRESSQQIVGHIYPSKMFITVSGGIEVRRGDQTSSPVDLERGYALPIRITGESEAQLINFTGDGRQILKQIASDHCEVLALRCGRRDQ